MSSGLLGWAGAVGAAALWALAAAGSPLDPVEAEFEVRARSLAPPDAPFEPGPEAARTVDPRPFMTWLLTALSDEDWTVRERGLEALRRRRLLGRTGWPETPPAERAWLPEMDLDFERLLADPSPNVREAALRLWLVSPPATGPIAQLRLLEPLVADPWPAAAELAVRAIACVSVLEATAVLTPIAESGSTPELREAAALALAERYADGRGSAASLELVLTGDPEPELPARALRRLSTAPASRLEPLTEYAWSADEGLEAALHALSLAAGGAGDLERVVQHHFDAPLPADLRPEIARAVAKRFGADGARRYLGAGIRAAEIERAFAAGSFAGGSVLAEPTTFDAGLLAELERDSGFETGRFARRLFELALDAAPAEEVAEEGLDAIQDPAILELFLRCLSDEDVLFNAELVRRLGERARSRETLDLVIDLYDAAAQRGDGLARLALFDLCEHGDPGVEGLAFRSLARRLDTRAEAEVLHARAFAAEPREEQVRRLAWLGGGVPLEPFAQNLIALGMGDLELRDRAARLLARVTDAEDQARVLLTLERWLVEAQLAMSDGERETAAAAEREAATRVGQLGRAGGEAVVPSLLRSLGAATGRSVELGEATVRALGETEAGRAELLERIETPGALETPLLREAWMECADAAEVLTDDPARVEAFAELGAALLDGADAKQRSKIIAGLGSLRTPAARAALLNLARGDLELAALSAIVALGKLEGVEAELAAIAVEGPTYERRLVAIRALGRLGTTAALGRLAAFDALLREGADWNLAHPDERPLLADELRIALAEAGRLPEGALAEAWERVLRSAPEDQADALAGRRTDRASLRWRAPLAVLEAAIRDGSFEAWLAGDGALGVLARVSPEFLGEAVPASIRGGDAAAFRALAEARVAALAGLERPLELLEALKQLAEARDADGGELADTVRERAARLAREFEAAR